MSVYTKVSSSTLLNFLKNYDLGNLVSYEGISQGITNTNYFINTTLGKFILTIFETLNEKELIPYLNLMLFLNKNNVKCPTPILQSNDNLYGLLYKKPSVIISYLDGKDIEKPSLIQCYNVGNMLAKFHINSKNFSYKIDNTRGLNWFFIALDKLKIKLDADEFNFLSSQINNLIEHQEKIKDLPKGIIHADLFKDNVLFDEDNVSGFIDLYYACNGLFIYDIAIAINDFARNDDNTIDYRKKEAFLNGYEKERKLTLKEKTYFNLFCKKASIRFYLSRLLDYHFPIIGNLTYIKNPNDFKELLLFYNSN